MEAEAEAEVCEAIRSFLLRVECPEPLREEESVRQGASGGVARANLRMVTIHFLATFNFGEYE
jgi:hypothetical protein